MLRGRTSTNIPCAFSWQILPSDLMRVGLSGCIQQFVFLGDTGETVDRAFLLTRVWMNEKQEIQRGE